MPATTEPRSGLKYGWTLGESGWNLDVDANWKTLGRFGFHLSVKDRDFATPPIGPANGDTYIVAAAGTGAWSGHDAKIAIWDSVAGAWVFFTPRVGVLAYLEDEEKLTVYKVAGWSAGVAI